MSKPTDTAGQSWSKNIPLVLMTEEQLQATFDAIGGDFNRDHLESVRVGRNQDILVVVSILIMNDGTERVAGSDCEYGDGEGIRFIDDWIAEIRRTGQLRKGERLERRLFKAVL